MARARPGADLLVLIAAAGAGMAIAAYLTVVHYAHIPLACSVTGVVNCAEVTQSSYSVMPGTSVPVTVPGMIWFAVSGLLAGLAVRATANGRREPRRLRGAHLAWSLAGLAAVLYLVYAEVVVIHRICEWCTAVHALILITVLLSLARAQRMAPSDGLTGADQ
ncbi:MAG: vitamin K epoxide reductase family protein [Candidatus Dormibacteraceae bacterium]